MPVAATQTLSGARRMVWRITAPPANAGGGTGGATGCVAVAGVGTGAATGAAAVAGGGAGEGTGGGGSALDRPSQSWRRAAKPRSANMTRRVVTRLDAPGISTSRSIATSIPLW